MFVSLPIASYDMVSFLLETLCEVTGNETTGTRDANLELGSRHVWLESIFGEVAHFFLYCSLIVEKTLFAVFLETRFFKIITEEMFSLLKELYRRGHP